MSSAQTPPASSGGTADKSVHFYNPLLDSLFNNQQPSKSPLKAIIEELSRHHNEYTILVPPSRVLHSHLDPQADHQAAQQRLRDLCYTNEDFIKSHIIRTSVPYSSKATSSASSKSILVIYNSMNGKQVLVKNGMVFPGKGFGRALTVRILKIDYFHSVTPYFPQGAGFMIIYTDQPMVGSYGGSTAATAIPNGVLLPLKVPKRQPAVSQTQTTAAKQARTTSIDNITFEKLLRSFPLLSKAVSDRYFQLFHHNNYQYQILRPGKVKDLDTVETEFLQILDNLFKIVQDSVDVNTPNSEVTLELINNILKTYKGLDLNKLIHEYVELNLYDKVWTQLLLQFEKKPYYETFANLTLNQLDISIVKPWELNELYKRISLAIEEVKKLNNTALVNLLGNIKVMVTTTQYLTSPSSQERPVNLMIDADTLLGLFVIVLVQSRVPDLEAHLFYVKHFNYAGKSQNDGYLSYVLNNFDAVVLHLNSSLASTTPSENGAKDFIELAQENTTFWELIESKDTDKLSAMLETLPDRPMAENHFLRSKTIDGESCLMKCIKVGAYEAFRLLVLYNLDWISIDDILFDKNTTTDQTLLMVAIIEEHKDITSLLIDILELDATQEEQIAYYNSTDHLGRTIGHYLHHDIDLIDKVGPLLDWKLKDLQDHTPLFSLCRCYDHPDYSALISKAFSLQKNTKSFDVHIDKNGNTLLHVIQRDLLKTNLLSPFVNTNVNQFNHKNLTPLALYVKYNRIENLRDILRDPRLDFNIVDNSIFYNVFDYSGSNGGLSVGVNESAPGKDNLEIDTLLTKYLFKQVFGNYNIKHKVLATHAKFDHSTKDWTIIFKKINEEEGEKILTTFSHSMEYIQQNIYLIKLQYPHSMLLLKDSFFQNFPSISKMSVYPKFSKFKINKFIEMLNIFLISLNFHPKYSETDEIWERFDVSHKKLTLEMIKTIKQSNEAEKSQIGEVKLSTSKIQEIEFFLNFSMNDLLKFKYNILRFNKIINLFDLKKSDLKLVVNGLLNNLHVGNDSLQQSTVEGETTEYGVLLNYTTQALLFVNELIENVSDTIDRIVIWKQLHGQIIELNGEISKYENNNGIVGVSDESISSFFNLSLLIESKQDKYKKLLYSKSELIKRILDLNVQLKLDHEILAAEISSFLKYKSDFLCYSLRLFSRVSVIRAKERVYELQRLIQK